MTPPRYRPATLLVLTIACHPAMQREPGPANPDAAAIGRDIGFLAGPALGGRAAGTAGNDGAARYLARHYAALGLTPLTPAFEQRFFVARSPAEARAEGGGPVEVSTQNVIALLPGRDPALRRQYVIIGAHYDGLGRSTVNALDPAAGAVIRSGADDNASGTAAVLELARLFARRPTRRSLLFVNFSAEEMGLLGSAFFVEHAPVPLGSMVAMLNFDMVGRLRDDRLRVYGVGSAGELARIVRHANSDSALTITTVDSGIGPSDHTSFYLKGIPVLHFFTDVHGDYHTARDRAELINVAGEARVVALVARIVRDLGDASRRIPFSGAGAPARIVGATARKAPTVYLGGIPDMAWRGGPGVRMASVRPGSPAESGGLRAGDVIVSFNGRPIADFYAYNDLLYSMSPGDILMIGIFRDGRPGTVTVTLVARAD